MRIGEFELFVVTFCVGVYEDDILLSVVVFVCSVFEDEGLAAGVSVF